MRSFRPMVLVRHTLPMVDGVREDVRGDEELIELSFEEALDVAATMGIEERLGRAVLDDLLGRPIAAMTAGARPDSGRGDEDDDGADDEDVVVDPTDPYVSPPFRLRDDQMREFLRLLDAGEQSAEIDPALSRPQSDAADDDPSSDALSDDEQGDR